MPGGYKKLRGEDCTKKFTTENQPTPEQRAKHHPLRQLSSKIKDLIGKDGEMVLPKKLIVREESIETKKGKFEDCIILRIPTIDEIAIRWLLDTKSGRFNIRSRSRETLIDRLEGKASQSIDLTTGGQPLLPKYNFSVLTDKEFDYLVKIQKKLTESQKLLSD